MKPEYYLPTKIYQRILKKVSAKDKNDKKKRPNVGKRDDISDRKIYCRKIILTDNRDMGGAYWEKPENSEGLTLFVNYTLDMKYIHFEWRQERGSNRKKNKYNTVPKSNTVYAELLAFGNRENMGSRPEAEKAKKKIYCRELVLKNGIDAGGHNWGKVSLVCVYFTEDKTYIEWEKPQYGVSEKAKLLLG